MSAAGLSVVLPAFDEGALLAASVDRVLATLRSCGRRHEVLLVDDGSRDDTLAVAHAAARRHPGLVRVLAHRRNEGKGRALATGCAAAREDLVVLLDADLQIPPEAILPLVGQLEAAGADVAVGSKYHAGAQPHWPWHRAALSRLYHLVTAVLFRLPLRDTQTGLKVVRRAVALDLVPHLTCRRFAWDLELLLLAHRAGRHTVVGPVRVDPGGRPSRVTPLAALHAGWDTLRIWWRDRALACRSHAPAPAALRPTLAISADDLGLCASTDRGIHAAADAGALTAAGVLVTAPGAEQAVRSLRAAHPGVGLGLHLDLLGGRSLLAFAWQHGAGERARHYARGAVRAQLAALRAWGVEPRHLDAHRHAWALPAVRRAVLEAAAREGIRVVRPLTALGGFGGRGPGEWARRAVLAALAVPGRGAARARGLCEAHAFVDAGTAASWVRRGRLPAWTRGRTLEIVGHPLRGVYDGPAGEAAGPDRAAETVALLAPPLGPALAALGARVVAVGDLGDDARRRHRPCASPSSSRA